MVSSLSTTTSAAWLLLTLASAASLPLPVSSSIAPDWCLWMEMQCSAAAVVSTVSGLNRDDERVNNKEATDDGEIAVIGKRSRKAEGRHRSLLSSSLSSCKISSSSASSAVAIRVNLGSDVEARGSSGLVFSPQAYLAIGAVFEVRTSRPIIGVRQEYPEALYQTLVQSELVFMFHIPVEASRHVKIIFHFCELTNFGPGARQFSVRAEGQLVIDKLDVAEEAGNYLAHIVQTDTIEVTPDGILDIVFLPVEDFAMISGIEVIPSLSLRLNFGSLSDVLGNHPDGLAFQGTLTGHQFLTVGSTAPNLLGSGSISGVDDCYPEELYRSRITGSSGFTYSIDISPTVERVDIMIHFCEDSGTAPGERVQSVHINGDPVIRQLDVAAQVGSMHALVKLVRVFMDPGKAGKVDIAFSEETGNNATVNALEILPLDSAEPVRINMGSYETLVGEDDDGAAGLVFGSSASWMYLNGHTPPLYYLTNPWPPNHRVVDDPLKADAEYLEPGVPEGIYASRATGLAFGLKFPIGWSGPTTIRLHFRRVFNIRDKTSLAIAQRNLYSPTASLQERVSDIQTDRHVEDNEVYVWEVNVDILDGRAYLFFYSGDGIPMESFEASVSGIELFSSAENGVPVGKPIRIKEGSGGHFDVVGGDWLPASRFRTADSEVADYRFPDPLETLPNPLYSKELYTNCVYSIGDWRDFNRSIHYYLPAVATNFEIRVHMPRNEPLPGLLQLRSFYVLVNGIEAAFVTLRDDNAQIFSSLSFQRSEVLTSASDGTVHVELRPRFLGGTDTVGVCGIELWPLDRAVIRANSNDYYPNCPDELTNEWCWPMAYGDSNAFFTAPDTLLSPAVNSYRFYNGLGTIDELWTRQYPEQVLRTYVAATGFGRNFVFEFASPRMENSELVEFARVRLLFVELHAAFLGLRRFHVEINNVRVLTNYTMAIDGWSSHSLIIEEFPIAINGRDTIRIEFITPSPEVPPLPVVTNEMYYDDLSTELRSPGSGNSVVPTGQINGFEVLPLHNRLHIDGLRVSCGGYNSERDFVIDDYYQGDDMGVKFTAGGSARYGMNLTYSLPVAPQTTHVFVRLGFVELENKGVGGRLCSVAIQGLHVKAVFDIAAEAVGSGAQAASISDFFVVGPDRSIEIALSSKIPGVPCLISTIEMIPFFASVDDAMLLDCGQSVAPYGGPSYPFTAAIGETAQNYFDPSEGEFKISRILMAYQPRLTIKNVPLDVPQVVFKSMVYGEVFGYQFQVPSEAVRVILHVADNCWHPENVHSRVFDSSCGVRIMDVFLQGTKVLADFAAAPLTAYTKSFDIQLDANENRVVRLLFDSKDKSDESRFAFINGIEVINLKPFTLDAGSSLYKDYLAYGHYLVNAQSPRLWATQKEILNNKEYPPSLYETLFGSKDFTYQFPCNPKAVLIRLHFCDITESAIKRQQRVYVDGEIVLENFAPADAALAAFQRDANQEEKGASHVAFYWDKLHFRTRESRKVRVRIESQVPGEHAILSAIQILPLFDSTAYNFGVRNKMKNLGTQNVMGYQGGDGIDLAFEQKYSVKVTGTHGFLIIKFKEIHKESERSACDQDRRRYNSLYMNGEEVLSGFDVCQLAGGYKKRHIWSGSVAAGEDGVIQVETSSSRPYEYPIVDEIEVFSHFIHSDDDESGRAPTSASAD